MVAVHGAGLAGLYTGEYFNADYTSTGELCSAGHQTKEKIALAFRMCRVGQVNWGVSSEFWGQLKEAVSQFHLQK